MKRWRVLSIGNTDVFLHPAVIVYLGYGALTGHLSFMLFAFVSIVLHEAAHGVVSACLGQSPARIEITPLGAVMRLEDEEKLSPFKRMLMILAGPVMTLVLCWLAIMSVSHSFLTVQQGKMLFLSNLSILLLNLLPVLPLDGGRLLMLLLESVLPKNIAARVVRVISMSVGAGLILLNIVFSWRNGGWNLSLAFAGCCIIYSATVYTITHALSELRFFLDRKILIERKGSVKTKCVTALDSVPVCQLLRHLPPRQLTMFICMETGTGVVLGDVHETALIQSYLDKPGVLLGQVLKEQNLRRDSFQSGTI